MMRPYQIAVCGSAGDEAEDIRQKAETIGREIAERGHILFTGATTGLPWHAAKAAQKAGGLSIGISPSSSRYNHIHRYQKPTQEFDVMVYTGFGLEGRNVVLVRSADAVIFIGGRIGTVMEFTAAYQSVRVIGILKGSGGNSDLLPEIAANAGKEGGKIIHDEDPVKLLDAVISSLE